MRYREHAPLPELRSLVACTWERRAPAGESAPASRVLPDGCVDLIWRGSELLVAGPDRELFLNHLKPGETVVGLRLRPGVAGKLLGFAARVVRDQRVSLKELWRDRGAELEERLGLAAAPWQQRRLLEKAVAARRAHTQAPDPLVLAATRVLGLPGARVDALSEVLGTSERQLLRRFDEAVGYGPKTLDRVLRFQRFLSIAPRLAAEEGELARVAAGLGYADQAHLTRECRRLSGLTPVRLATERG